MTKMRITMALFITLFSLASFAWREGNGGDGVRLNQKLYLLDLVEGGVEQANSSDIVTSNSFIEKEVNQWADAQSQDIPRAEIIQKLGEIHRKNSVMAYVMLMTLQKLDWAWVNVPLKNVADEGPLNILLQQELVQLAIRVNKTIQIHTGSWNELDRRNQTALILHEVLFSLVNPERTSKGISMSSPRVRRMVGFLFSKKIQKNSLDEMLAIEAPELRLQSIDNKPVNVSYYLKNKSELILNASWVIQVQTSSGDLTLIKEAGLKDSTETSTRAICELASEAGAIISLKLNADVIKLSLRANGKNESEDYNYINSFTQGADLMTLVLDQKRLSGQCASEINKNKKAVLKQVLK